MLAQITHTAPEGQLADPIAASAKPLPSWKRQPRAMTTEEVEEMTGQFAQAIRRAKTAGFDGVEIYAAGYLLGSFLSPYTNTRTDRFGGSLENRVRVIADIISKARKLVGSDFPILAKLNCDDGLEGGTNIDTFPAVAAQVEKAGVAAIDVIGPVGNLEGESYFLKYAQKLRVKVPVILTGGNRNVDRLEQILQAGPPDFVAMARPFIREPDLAARWQARKGDPQAAVHFLQPLPGWFPPRQDHALPGERRLADGSAHEARNGRRGLWRTLTDCPQFVKRLRYIHRNPVKAGLCKRPENWEWSSFRHCATGAEGRVEVESEWTARKRERAEGNFVPGSNCPTQAKTGLEWATRSS